MLFGCTIGENIKQGRKGVTQEEMEKACVEANAYNFVKKLPKVKLINHQVVKYSDKNTLIVCTI